MVSRGKQETDFRGQTIEDRRQPPLPLGFGAPRRTEKHHETAKGKNTKKKELTTPTLGSRTAALEAILSYGEGEKTCD